MPAPAVRTNASTTARRRLPFALVSLLLHVIVLMAGVVFRDDPVLDAPGSTLEVVLLPEDVKKAPLVPVVIAEFDASGGDIEPQDRVDASAVPLQSEREADDGFVRAAVAGASVVPVAAGDTAPAAGAAALTAAPAHAPHFAASPPVSPGIDAPQASATRPKRLTYGIDAVGASYARYVRDWAARIEQLGTAHYPPKARGRLYDSLIITVEIDRHGEVVDIVINRPSRHEALNQAARRLVLAGAPYPPFTAEMAREGDILRIVRTWTFTNDGLEAAGASRT